MLGERRIKNPDDSGHWAKRDHHGPDDSKLRDRPVVVPRKRTDQLGRVLGIRRRCASNHGNEVALSRSFMADGDRKFHLAVPVGLDSSYTSRKSQNRHVFYLVRDRMLDFISHKENILATVNLLALTVLLMLFVRAVLAVDVGNAAITLAVGSVSLIIYFLSERSKKRDAQARRLDLSSDRVFEFADKERQRIDQASRHLREEERTFTQRQIERYGKMAEIARRRSHLYANAFSGIELANNQLVEILEKERIAVPSILRGNRVRESLWRELEKLASEEAGLTQDFANDAPPNTSSDQMKSIDGGE